MLSTTSLSGGVGQKMMAVRGSRALCCSLLLLLTVSGVRAAEQDSQSGTVIPAESRPCVDCHAFEFMQRALQDLKRTANNLNTRTEDLLLRVEQRALCDCLPSNLVG